MTRSTSERNHTTARRKSQHIFDWPALREAIAFYEGEHLCYLPAEWGQKKPAVQWERFQTRPPTIEEKTSWFQGKSKTRGYGTYFSAGTRSSGKQCNVESRITNIEE